MAGVGTEEEPQGRIGKIMDSPCHRQASKTCLHGCCAAHFLAPPPQKPNSSTTNNKLNIFRYDFTLATAASLCCYPNTQFTNHESLPSLHESYAYFIKAYPDYSQTDQADCIRAHEYNHLNLPKHVCLDYIGHGLFSFSQLQKHYQTPPIVSSSSSSSPPATTNIPESLNAPEQFFFDISYKSVNLHTQLLYGGQESEFEFEMKKRIMSYMNISQVDYTLVFTANQSSAFKLLADSYPFQNNPNLLSVYDYKNEAVDVMAEICKKRRGRVMSAEFSWPNMRIHTRKLRRKIEKRKKMRKRPGLFVFPLQSRVTGVRYSYQWMSIAQENGWHVLLDACALGPKDTETLGLSLFKPDFLICSFFKIFGENPSGFGCLFVKKSSASVLKDSSVTSSIGIVSLIASSIPPQVVVEKSSDHKEISLKQKAHAFSEIEEPERDSESDQSENYESYESGKSSGIECRGLDNADELGLVLISRRARYLINWLVNALMSLQYPHYSEYGHQLVKIYGPKIKFDRGPCLAFNVFDWKGEKIEPSVVQKLADRHNISLSYGILDHIWFSDKHQEEKETKSETCRSEEEGAHVSVVTAALGFLTTFEDVYRLWTFVSRFLDADFVEKERWRYMALNQKTVEV